MTFEKQLKEAKKKKLTNRIMRDAVFIILGITFLIISFISAYNKNSEKENNNNKINVQENK